jgi:division protein CdvB (Snf7/Vps24/ESCRT-III family)
MDKHQQFMSDILTASTVVHNQLIRLNMLDKKFTLMDKDLRHKIAANIKVGNNATARALAIELSNIHRVQRTTQNMSLALEVIVIRFSTINEFALVLDTINPTIDMIKDIQSDISRTVPTASHLLSQMTSMTSDVLHNSNITSEMGKISNSNSIDADALSILNEVEGILEHEAKSRLPEVPATLQEVRLRREVDEVIVKDDLVMVES